MTDKIYTIEEIKKIVAPIAKEHGIKRIYLFGSYARGEATPASDIDFRFDAKSENAYIGLDKMYVTFEEQFKKNVDVVRTQNLDLSVMFNICEEEILIYDD